MRSCWRTQRQPFYRCSSFEATEKVKKLDKQVPYELTANQKNHRFEALSSLTLPNNEPFLDQTVTWQKMGLIQQPEMISSVVGLRRGSKLLPKAKPVTKKGHGGRLLVWHTTAFWILVKWLHLRRTEKCNACSLHCSTEQAQSAPW